MGELLLCLLQFGSTSMRLPTGTAHSDLPTMNPEASAALASTTSIFSRLVHLQDGRVVGSHLVGAHGLEDELGWRGAMFF